MSAFVPSFFPNTLPHHPPTFTRSTVLSAMPHQQPSITLYSVPVSNYSARVRYLVYRKNLSDSQLQIRAPTDLGGVKTAEYLAMNPLGKVPAVVIHGSDGQQQQFLYESSVICEYVAEVFTDNGPSFIPCSAEKRGKARLIANLLDVYIGPQHGYMYKRGMEGREEEVEKMKGGFDAIESTMDESGPYAVGDEVSLADCCLWGNWAFYEYMLPTFFGWRAVDGRPKLGAWVEHMRKESDAAREVYREVFEGLEGWWEKGRWNELCMTAVTPRPQMPF